MTDQSVSARRWQKPLGIDEREQVLLDVLDALGGWADVPTIGREARRRGVKVAPGTLRTMLDRVADAGKCERRKSGPTSASFRYLHPSEPSEEKSNG